MCMCLMSYQSSRFLSLNPHFHTFYYFLPHQLWLLTPSQAILLLVSLPLLSQSITLSVQYLLRHSFFISLSPLSLSLSPLFFHGSLSSSLPVLVLFCPSGVWDSRQCWEAYGLLIKKQGGTRPQLTRTHTHRRLHCFTCKDMHYLQASALQLTISTSLI